MLLLLYLSVSAMDGALEAQRPLARQRVHEVLEGDGRQAQLTMLQSKIRSGTVLGQGCRGFQSRCRTF